MPSGTYASQFVLQALFTGHPGDHGLAGLAVLTSDAKNSWLSMIKQGATATMEMWTIDEKPNDTWSHVWSASPGFIIPWYVFGIQPLEPGWTKMSIKPAPGTLTRGEYTMPTIRGAVSAHFTSAVEGDSATRLLKLTVTLPAGTEARVSLPAYTSVAQRGAVMMMDGVATKFVVEPAHWTVESVGPGTHSFEIVNSEDVSTAVPAK